MGDCWADRLRRGPCSEWASLEASSRHQGGSSEGGPAASYLESGGEGGGRREEGGGRREKGEGRGGK